MSKAQLRGLTISIGGDTTNLVSALDRAETAGKRLGNTAENLKKKLVFKWDNSTFTRAQKAAQDAVKATTERVDYLKQALKDVEAGSDTKKAQNQITELKSQIEKAEAEAEKAKKRLQEMDQVKLDHIIHSAEELGKKLVSAGAKITAGITAPVAIGAAKAIESASDLAESQNVVEVAFGDSAAMIDQWSKTLISDFGMSELSAKKYAGNFMTLASSMGVAHDNGVDMAQTLTELSSDMASFYNVEQAVAANALKSIFTGETETMKQFGVVMTEANLSAFALSQGLETAYTKMSQSEKVMLRYQYVMNALSNAQGDFANTNTGFANQQRVLQAQLETLAAELGKELLPIVEDMVQEITKLVGQFAKMSDEEKKATVTMLAIAAAIGPTITAVGGLANGVAAVTKAVKAAQTAWAAHTAAMAAGTSVISKVTTALKGLEAANIAMTAAQAGTAAGAAALVAGLLIAMEKIGDYYREVANATTEMENAAAATAALEESLNGLSAGGLAASNEKLGEMYNLTENIIPRIEELADKTDRTGEETDELQGLIAVLNDQLGSEVASFNAATGAVNLNTNAIYKNIAAIKARALAQAASAKVETLGSQIIDAQQSILDNDKKIADLEGKEIKNTWWNRTFGEGVFNDRAIKKLENQNRDNQRLIDEATKAMDDLTKKYIAPYYDTDTSGTSADNTKGTDGLTRTERKTAFEAELSDLKYYRQLGAISNETYRNQLRDLNNKYNYDDKETWRKYYSEVWDITTSGEDRLTKAVKSGGGSRASAVKASTAEQTAIVKQAYQEQVAAAKAAYEQQKALLKSQYEESVKQIDAELKAKEAAINAEIAAIQKEIEARKRAKEEENYDTQINAIKASLAYGGGKFDEFTQRQLENQLKEIEEERADYRWELEQQDRIDLLEQQLEDARTLAEQQKEALKEMYELQLERLEEEYELHLEMLDEIFKKSNGEFRAISEAFVSAMQAGAASAAAALRAAIEDAKGAASSISKMQLRNLSGAGTESLTDNRSYSMTLNNAGYTDAQAARVFKSMMFE